MVGMTGAVADRTNWNMPSVTTDERGVTSVDFRDCVVDVEQGLVCRYLDKQTGVHLRPSEGLDNWGVFTDAGQTTGQIWKGIIAFDGAQLLIQQSRNQLFRLYRTDGTIETQLRMTRIVERPGLRTLVFPHGQFIEEDLTTGVLKTNWGDRLVVRQPSGITDTFDAEGNPLASAATASDAVVGQDLLVAFGNALHNWDKFNPPNSSEHYFGGPPGLTEASPGQFFSRLVTDKPDDVREVVSHDFADGTVLHEYLGRLSGVPFLGHELVTRAGLVLARMVEYDQPKKITFCDPRGLIRDFAAVQKVEMQYDPQRGDYVTCITDPSGSEFIHPKGATFERGAEEAFR
jgi:hypothetical protein